MTTIQVLVKVWNMTFVSSFEEFPLHKLSANYKIKCKETFWSVFIKKIKNGKNRTKILYYWSKTLICFCEEFIGDSVMFGEMNKASYWHLSTCVVWITVELVGSMVMMLNRNEQSAYKRHRLSSFTKKYSWIMYCWWKKK